MLCFWEHHGDDLYLPTLPVHVFTAEQISQSRSWEIHDLGLSLNIQHPLGRNIGSGEGSWLKPVCPSHGDSLSRLLLELMGNRDFFQIRAAKQGRYKLSIRRWQPGENLLKYYPTARRAELRGVERLISDNIWASAGSRTWGFTPWTSQIHGQCTSLLFKSDRVGFLPFVSKSILTNPHIHWSRGKNHICNTFAK